MSTLNKIRRTAHRVEVYTGDVQAIKRGRIARRVTNRIAGRALSKVMRRLWR